jgi:Flp pilus assembly protein TadD
VGGASAFCILLKAKLESLRGSFNNPSMAKKKKSQPVSVTPPAAEVASLPRIRRAFSPWLSSTVVFCSLLMVLTLVAYWPVTQAGFTWDDEMFISKNPNLVNETGLRHIWLNPAENPHYYPVLMTVLWLQYQAWGADPLGYHMVNVLLHGLSAVCLFLLLRRMKMRGAWLAGLIFALHPVFVESVAWVTEMKNTLSGVFYLLALYFWVRHMERDDARPAWWSSAYVAAWLAGILALLGKSTAASLPLAALLLALWRTPRLTGRRIAGVLLLLLPAVAFGLYSLHFERFVVERNVGGVTLPLAGRILVAGCAFWFYIGKLLWPADLVMIYPMWHPDLSGWQWYVPLVALGIGGFCLWFFRKWCSRGCLAGLLFFAVTVSPIPFMDIAYLGPHSYVADHFLYLPGMGFVALIAAGLVWAVHGVPRIGRHALFSVLVLVLAVLTWRQSALYKGGALRMWERVLVVNPDSVSAQNNLGAELARLGRFEEALPHFEKALRIDPEAPLSCYNMGYSLCKVGRVPDAIPYYERALMLNSDNVEAHAGLAVALPQVGRMAEAIPHYEEVLRRRKDNDIGTLNNLAALLALVPAAEGGDVARAVALAQQACAMTTNQAPSCLGTLAMAYAAGGDFDKAIQVAERRIALVRSMGRQDLMPDALVLLQTLEAQKKDGMFIPSRPMP